MRMVQGWSRKIWLIAFMALSFSGSIVKANNPEISLKNKNKLVRTLNLEEAKKLVKSSLVKVWEPHENEEIRYEVIPVNELFNAIYGNTWKTSEEVLFTCADGYQSSIPSELFQRHRAYLAFARPDAKTFTLNNKLQNETNIVLGPFYLIWDNLSDKDLKAEGATYWPYQVTALDLISFADRFPRMAPPKNTEEKARRGFLAFRKHCMTCHTVNGEGGAKAIELNYPVSVTEYMKRDWLKRWISAPEELRWRASMPALNPELANRDQTIEAIVSYLEAMAKHKQKPAL